MAAHFALVAFAQRGHVERDGRGQVIHVAAIAVGVPGQPEACEPVGDCLGIVPIVSRFD
jgi:hypothetical protein